SFEPYKSGCGECGHDATAVRLRLPSIEAGVPVTLRQQARRWFQGRAGREEAPEVSRLSHSNAHGCSPRYPRAMMRTLVRTVLYAFRASLMAIAGPTAPSAPRLGDRS